MSIVKCLNCGKSGDGEGYYNKPYGWIIIRNWLGGAKGVVCCERCKEEYDRRHS